MGIFDIFRRKKEEDILGMGKIDQRLGLPSDANSANPGFSGYPQEQQGNSQFSGFPQQQYPQYQPYPQQGYPQQGYGQDSQSQAYLLSKNLELLSAKLDSIQITLQNLGQRMANIEAKLSAGEGRARMW